MKRVLVILLLLSHFSAIGQPVYTPSQHIISSTATGYSNATPTDARSQFYDNNVFKYRDYQSTAEVLTYLNLAKSRTGHFPIYVHSGGSLSSGVWTNGSTLTYSFRDCTADTCLQQVGSPTLSIQGDTAIAITGVSGNSVVLPGPTLAQFLNYCDSSGNVLPTLYGGKVRWDMATNFKLGNPSIVPVSDSALLLQGLAKDLYAAKNSYDLLSADFESYKSYIKNIVGDSSYVPVTTWASVPGLVADYNADTLITASGSNITAWGDASGNGNSLSVVPTTSSPLYTSPVVAINNHRAVNFTGGGHGLYASAFTQAATNNMTVYIVYYNPGAGTQSYVELTNGISTDSAMMFLYQYNNGTSDVLSTYVRGDAGASSSEAVSTAGTWHYVVSESLKGAASNEALTTVSGAAGSASGSMNNTNAFHTAAPFYVGTNAPLTYANRGMFARILVYRQKHSDPQKAVIVDYLKSRYGI